MGKGAKAAFAGESGGHQWQRIPPTEKKGRVHTSLITVAVLPEPDLTQIKIPEKDLKMDIARGSGKGGQKRNKTETAVRLTHIPTGISVHIDSRHQNQNKELAMEILMGRLQERAEDEKHSKRVNDRRGQIGDGERGGKTRVIREKDAVVINTKNDKSIAYKDYCRGNLADLI